jgi:acetylornithine/succinyldiaminopimelate/putrescine aminotransferase
MDSVIQAYDDETAAVICEPIQSIGGVLQAPPSFYQDLANFCKEKGILLIFDEVQTGVGRTGYFWAAQLFKVTPDIITSAKGLATGLPIAAVLINHSVSEKLDLSDHASTFGGGPIPCAAGFAVVSTISSDGFLAEVLKKSDYLQAQLRSLPHVREVRGEGFLLGFELDQAFPDFLNSVLANGLITGGASHKNTYRLTPPLTISTDDIDECIRILDSILSQ